MLAAGQSAFSARTACRRPRRRWAQRQVRSASDLELRLIGPLQTNKAKEAVLLFGVIETLDRAKAGGRDLADAMSEGGLGAETASCR